MDANNASRTVNIFTQRDKEYFTDNPDPLHIQDMLNAKNIVLDYYLKEYYAHCRKISLTNPEQPTLVKRTVGSSIFGPNQEQSSLRSQIALFMFDEEPTADHPVTFLCDPNAAYTAAEAMSGIGLGPDRINIYYRTRGLVGFDHGLPEMQDYNVIALNSLTDIVPDGSSEVVYPFRIRRILAKKDILLRYWPEHFFVHEGKSTEPGKIFYQTVVQGESSSTICLPSREKDGGRKQMAEQLEILLESGIYEPPYTLFVHTRAVTKTVEMLKKFGVTLGDVLLYRTHERPVFLG